MDGMKKLTELLEWVEVSEVELKSIRLARTWDEKKAEKVEERGRQSGGRREGSHIEECRENLRPMIWRCGEPKSFHKLASGLGV